MLSITKLRIHSRKKIRETWCLIRNYPTFLLLDSDGSVLNFRQHKRYKGFNSKSDVYKYCLFVQNNPNTNVILAGILHAKYIAQTFRPNDELRVVRNSIENLKIVIWPDNGILYGTISVANRRYSRFIITKNNTIYRGDLTMSLCGETRREVISKIKQFFPLIKVHN